MTTIALFYYEADRGFSDEVCFIF